MKQKYTYILAAAHLFNDANSGALPAILPFLVTAYGMDYKSVAGLMFAQSFLSSIIQPAFGYLADKMPKKWFMPMGLLVCGISLGFVGFLEDYWLIFAAVTCSGIGSAIFHPEAARMLNQVSGPKKGTALSIFSVGGNGGFSIGPLLAVACIVPFGLKGTAVFGLLAILIAVALFYSIINMKTSVVSENAADTVMPLSHSQAGCNNWRAFSRLTFIIFCRSVVFCALNSFLPLFWITILSQSNTAGASALTLLYGFGVVTTLVGGVLSDRFGYITIIKWSAIALVPSLILLSLTKNVIVASILLIPVGIAVFAPYSSIVVLGQKYLASSIGFASGVTLGLSFSVGGVAAPFLGWLADEHGLVFILQLLAAIGIVGVIAAFLLPRPDKLKTISDV